MAVTFQNQNLRFTLRDKNPLKAWIGKVILSEKKTPGQINFVFTGDEDLYKINVEFLNHSTYTDIITFDSCFGKLINGDIIISVDRVRENARRFGVPFENELHRVMIHGVLHLCGYKDKTKSEKEKMRRLESRALRLLAAQ